MKKGQWSKQVVGSELARRAGGRRRHNAAKKRGMWDRRFEILQMMSAMDGDLPHGTQRDLAERFGVHKSAISRDVKWAREIGSPGSGFTLRCSYRRGGVRLTWINTEAEEIMKKVGNVLRALRKHGAKKGD